jgi:hypothetical protein
MRESLKKSVAHSPDKGFERYRKGSVVLCNACSLPILKLDRAIALGDKMGQLASAFKPLSVADLLDLAARQDIDAGVRALLRAMGPEQRQAHVGKLREMRSGDPCICPACDRCFVQVVSVDRNEALDKSYTVELVVIPPFGTERPAPVRGKRISATGDWIH